MLVLIDNYDSFTYNLVQYLGELGADIRVFRNDQVTLDQLIALNPSHLVISPGPGEPIKDGGISAEAIRHFTGKIPVLGVCLGHQCLGSVLRQDRPRPTADARQDLPGDAQRAGNF